MWSEKSTKAVTTGSILLLVGTLTFLAKKYDMKHSRPVPAPAGDSAHRDQEKQVSVTPDHGPTKDGTVTPTVAPADPHLEIIALAPVSPAPVPEIQPDGCFTVTYSHKKMPSHADGEACLRHRNLIVLPHSENPKGSNAVNADSICIRVNNLAVRHTQVAGKKYEVLIGPEAGPGAKITASFCTGKKKCTEKCVYKKDEFMAALGGEELSAEGQPGWDGSQNHSKDEAELEKEMSALNKDGSGKDSNSEDGNTETTHSAKAPSFTGWIAEDPHPSRCL